MINRSAVVAYADRWAKSTNPLFQRYGNDCTNFVSQAWFAPEEGGVITATGYPRSLSGVNLSADWVPQLYPWVSAQGFVDFQRGNGHRLKDIDMNNPGEGPNGGVWSRLVTNVTPGLPGDVAVYRTYTAPDNPYWSHAAVVVDTVYVGEFRDTGTGVVVPYNTTVDRVDAHTHDRLREPWNIGFRADEIRTTDPQELNQHKTMWDAQIVGL